MAVFKNDDFSGRAIDVATVVACEAETAPANGSWSISDETILSGLDHLFTRGGARFYGYL